MNSKLCTIPQKAYSKKHNFVLWVCLLLLSSKLPILVPLWAHAPGQAAAAFAYLHGVPPRHKAAFHQGLSRHLVPEMTGGDEPHEAPSWLETRILKSWRICIYTYIYTYSMYDNDNATDDPYSILYIGCLEICNLNGDSYKFTGWFLNNDPYNGMWSSHIAHSNCVWIIPRGWKQVAFLASQGISSDQWEQCHSLGVGILIDFWVNLSYTHLEPLFDLLLNDWSLGLLLEGYSKYFRCKWKHLKGA